MIAGTAPLLVRFYSHGRDHNHPGRVQGPEDGMIRIWLEWTFFNELARMKGPGEDYSQVILRLAKT